MSVRQHFFYRVHFLLRRKAKEKRTATTTTTAKSANRHQIYACICVCCEFPWVLIVFTSFSFVSVHRFWTLSICFKYIHLIFIPSLRCLYLHLFEQNEFFIRKNRMWTIRQGKNSNNNFAHMFVFTFLCTCFCIKHDEMHRKQWKTKANYSFHHTVHSLDIHFVPWFPRFLSFSVSMERNKVLTLKSALINNCNDDTKMLMSTRTHTHTD